MHTREPLNKSQKLRANGARADKAQLTGNIDHLAKSCNAVSVCAIDSRRARHTGPVDCVALLDKVIYIACGALLATEPVWHAEHMRLLQRLPRLLFENESDDAFFL